MAIKIEDNDVMQPYINLEENMKKKSEQNKEDDIANKENEAKFSELCRRIIYVIIGTSWVICYNSDSRHIVADGHIITLIFFCGCFLFLDVLQYFWLSIRRFELKSPWNSVEETERNIYQYNFNGYKWNLFYKGSKLFTLVFCMGHFAFSLFNILDINKKDTEHSDHTVTSQKMESQEQEAKTNKDMIEMIERKRTDAQFVQGKER